MKTGFPRTIYFFLEGKVYIKLSIVTWRLVGGGVGVWLISTLEARGEVLVKCQMELVQE